MPNTRFRRCAQRIATWRGSPGRCAPCFVPPCSVLSPPLPRPAGVILVDDIAEEEILRELDIENPYELTGLYLGVPLTQKSNGMLPEEPDRILLFREPILLEWVETGEDLFRLVRNVLIHEVGHHFSFSDEDIERLEEGE